MSNKFNASAWVSGTTKPALTDYQNIQSDLAARGQTIDGGRYGRSNTSYLLLSPGDLTGNTYSVTGASWSSGSGGQITYTIGTHNIQANQHVSIASASPTGYNFSDISVVSVTTNTIVVASSSNPGTWVSGGTVTVNLAGAAAGMLQVDQNGNLRLYQSGAWQQFASSAIKAVLVENSSAISNTSAQTAFNKSFTIPAGAANVVGTIIRVRCAGTYGITGSPTIQLFILVGGNQVSALSLASGSGLTWVIEADVIVRTTGASATFGQGFTMESTGNAGGNGSSVAISIPSMNLTTTQVVTVAIQFSAASTSNTATMTALIVEVIPPTTTF